MILLDPLAHPVIAHRGASGRYPENTLLAFRKARETGADAIEFDVRTSADGVPVVIHDETVDRTTDGTGPVAALPLSALREFNAGMGERIPTLEEVLDDTGTTPMIIEVKERLAAKAVVEMLQARGGESRSLVGSFDARDLVGFRRAGVPTTAGRREVAWFWLASRIGAGAVRSQYEAFSVPPRYRGVRLVDARFVRLARRIGKPVHVWTVDDIPTATQLRVLGVAGIITNLPEQMGVPTA